MMQYEIEHRTRYGYARNARGCVLMLCLEPASAPGQRVLEFQIDTEPAASLSPELDWFGNRRHVLNVHRRHRGLTITSRCRLERTRPPRIRGSEDPRHPEPFRPQPRQETSDDREAGARDDGRSWSRLPEYWHFLRPSRLARPSAALEDFVRRERLEPDDDPMATMQRLSDTIHGSFDYQAGSTSADSPIEHVLESGRGVCQDFAHVMITIARSWGVPSRYVSGYLHTTGRLGEQTVATGSHAWVECRLPGAGWVGFDPTNATGGDERHIRVATGRDYADVSPTSGVFQGSGDAEIEVDVIVNAVGPLGSGETVSGRNRRQRG